MFSSSWYCTILSTLQTLKRLEFAVLCVPESPIISQLVSALQREDRFCIKFPIGAFDVLELKWSSQSSVSSTRASQVNCRPNCKPNALADMVPTLPTPTTIRHLYRSLLREATYLSDSQARSYIHGHLVRSFRRYSPRKRTCKSKTPPLTLPKLDQLLSKARKGLSVLSRANQGYSRPLQLVLCWTYARKGKRRRELLADLTHQAHAQPLSPAPPSSTSNAPDPSDIPWKPPPRHLRPPITPPPLITALLTSLGRHNSQLTRLRYSDNAFPKPEIPKTNRLGRPLSLARQRNLADKWYAVQLDKLYPPLPEPEVQRLRALAGLKSTEVNLSAEGPVSRRPPAKPVPTNNDQAENAPLWARGDSQDPLQALTPSFLLSGPPRPSKITPPEHGRPHVLAPRFMRHMYRSILEHVPMVEALEGEGRKFKITWPIQPRPRGLVGVVGRGNLEGVDVGLLFGGGVGEEERSAEG